MTTLFRRLCVAVCTLVAPGFAATAQGQSLLPAVPTGLAVSNLGDGQQAKLTWTDNSSNETGFHVMREKQFGSQWAASPVITLPVNTTSMTDSPGPGVFRYRVRSFNGSGTSIFTPSFDVTVVMTVPGAPTGLAFEDLGDGLRGQVSWNDQSANESGFELTREKETAPGVWTGAVTLTAGMNVEVINNMPGPGTFRYRVRSVNSLGPSAWTGWVVGVIAPVAGGTAPAAPLGLTATNQGASGAVRVEWTDASGNEAGFTIQRQTLAGAVWGPLVSIAAPANTEAYMDSPGAGTHRYRIRAYNAIGASAWVGWAIVVSGSAAPAAPSGLEFLDLGDGLRGRVSWTDESNNETGFELTRERQDSGGAWVQPTTLTAGANVEVINNMPGPGTFRYRVRSVNGAGVSAWTGWVIGVIADVPPPAPSSVTTIDVGNGSQVQVGWTDNALNETGFELERQDWTGASWAGGPTFTLPKNQVAYLDAPGLGMFRYRVRAVNGAGASAFTAWATCTVESVIPTAPSALAAVDLGNGLQARVTWQDNAGNESGFELERQTLSGSAWGPVSTLTLAANTGLHTDAPGEGTHRYRVRAVNTFGASAYTPWATVDIASPLPGAPANLAALDMGNGSQVRLSWQDLSSNETGFQVERQTQAGSVWGPTFTFWGAPNTQVMFNEAGLGVHRFRIRAVNTFGASAYTAWVGLTVASATPAAPSNLTVTDLGNGSQARVNWQDNSNNETAFQIQRQTQSGSLWGATATLGSSANTTQYIDSPGAGVHRYRVAAENAFGVSAFTGWVTVTVVPATPAAPSNLSVVDTGNRKALLSWTDNANNETSFQIERQPAFTGGMVSVSANVTGYLDSCGVGTFQYRVRAANGQGVSSWTAWVAVVVLEIPPAAPSGLTAVDFGNQNTVQVSWADNSDNETGFELERQTQTGQTWGGVTSMTSPANSTTRNDNAGVGTHRYRIRSVNGVGQSAWTGWSTCTVSAAGTGWTVFTPSVDTRKVYVSSSTGNDSNTGLSEATPKKTINAGKALVRNGFPDWLLLKRGDTWTNETLGHWEKSGRSVSEPLLISAYGPESAARPLLRTGYEHGFEWFETGGPQRLDFVSLVGLHFKPHLYNGTSNHASGLFFIGWGGHFLIEDCMFEAFATNIVVQEYAGRPDHVTIRRSVVADAYVVGASPHSQGLYLAGIDGLLVEECVVDHNGWREEIPGAVQTVFRHNTYIQSDCTNTVYRRNFCTQAAAHGVQARSGGVVEDNILVRNPINITFGGGDSPTPGGVTGTIRGNVILESSTLAGEGRGWGMEIYNINATGVLVENNIIANDQNPYNQVAIRVAPNGEGGWGAGVGIKKITIKSNVVYKWNAGIEFQAPSGGQALTGVTVQGNILEEPSASSDWLVQMGPSSVSPPTFAFSGNKYHSGRPASSWFSMGGNPKSHPQWVSAVSETGSSAGVVSLVQPTRNLGSYHATLGQAATLQAFMTEARKQRKGYWRQEYTYQPVLDYLRQGYAQP